MSDNVNNDRKEDEMCRDMSLDNKSCSDANQSFCVQSNSNVTSENVEIDSDIENSRPIINISTLSLNFDDNTSLSSLESEIDSIRDSNATAISNRNEQNDNVPSTILSNVISSLNQPEATILKIGSQHVVLNTPNSNPTENAKVNVTTSGVGVLNVGDQFNGTNLNVILCQDPKNPTVVLNSNGDGMY